MPIENQDHKPLSFLSGAFNGSSAGWSLPEKEGFAIVESMTKLDYLTVGTTVAIFTDHANLVYMYDPYGKNPGIPRHTASKLMRWALKLSSFRYVIEHVSGDRNVWADMLTRWAAAPQNKIAALKVNKMLLAPITPHLDEKYDWPTMADVKQSQRKASSHAPKRFHHKEGLLQDQNGVYWVPQEDELLKVRLLVAGHTGLGGHRGIRATKNAMKNYFWWTALESEVEVFIKSCLHCLLTESGEVIPRPMGHALHASYPNEIIHFDFCYLMKGDTNLSYVLIIKDDLSGYVWLMPTNTTDAETTASKLLSWFAAFGVVQQWVSDRGSHFKNEVVRELKQQLNSSHHFTLAYCPWSNGTVEVVCRELIRAVRAILSEFQLPQKCWPTIIPLVQSILNSTLLQRLGNRSPLQVFTGHKSDNPLLSITSTVNEKIKVSTLSEIRAKQVIDIERLQESLEQIHKDVKIKSSAKREAAVRRHNSKTNVREVNFTEGDFVLRGLLRKERGRKPAVRWTGPYRVIACKSDYIFIIRHLISSEDKEVHGRRLKLFRNKYFEVTEEIRNQLAYQDNEMLTVKDFEDIRKVDGEIEVLTTWRGFENEESSWVNIQIMTEDVPTLIREFITDIKSTGTSRQKRIAALVQI